MLAAFKKADLIQEVMEFLLNFMGNLFNFNKILSNCQLILLYSYHYSQDQRLLKKRFRALRSIACLLFIRKVDWLFNDHQEILFFRLETVPSKKLGLTTHFNQNLSRAIHSHVLCSFFYLQPFCVDMFDMCSDQ